MNRREGEIFTYRGVGNRLSRSGFNVTGRDETVHEVYSYNANNQLVSMWSPHTKVTGYQYDEAGNMTKATRGSAVCEYGFDYRNRMTSYDGPGGAVTSFSTGLGTSPQRSRTSSQRTSVSRWRSSMMALPSSD